jgi:hypothetical protein
MLCRLLGGKEGALVLQSRDSCRVSRAQPVGEAGELHTVGEEESVLAVRSFPGTAALLRSDKDQILTLPPNRALAPSPS